MNLRRYGVVTHIVSRACMCSLYTANRARICKRLLKVHKHDIFFTFLQKPKPYCPKGL
jgi:hypothetical protein